MQSSRCWCLPSLISRELSGWEMLSITPLEQDRVLAARSKVKFVDNTDLTQLLKNRKCSFIQGLPSSWAKFNINRVTVCLWKKSVSVPTSSWTKSLPRAFQLTREPAVPDSNLITFDLDICDNELIYDYDHISVLGKISTNLILCWYFCGASLENFENIW